MNYEVESQKGKVKISFALTNAEWDEEINKAYLKNKFKYNIPGFRKGHATRKMIENAYGAGVFFDEAFNTCFSRCYGEVLDARQDIYPVDEPKVDIEDFGDKEFKFKAEVTVKPEIKLGEYKGIKLPKVEYNVTSEEVKAEIDKALERGARFVDVTDRKIQNGDIVTLDYSGSVDGVKFAGGTASNQELTIGSNSFIPGFEEQMVGMSIGENKDLTVKFPEDYHAKELAGKDSVFAVTVNAVKVKELPELNDAFVKDISKFENVADYKKDLEKSLTEAQERRAKNENETALLDAVAERAQVEIPDCMIESQLDYMLQDFEYRLMYMYQGMKLDDYFKYTGSSKEDFRKSKRDEAAKAVKTRLAIEAIIKAEDMKVTDADTDAKLESVAKSAGKTLEEYSASLSGQQLSYMKNEILMDKLMEFLIANNDFGAESKKATVKKTAKSTDEGDVKAEGDSKPSAKKPTKPAAKKE